MEDLEEKQIRELAYKPRVRFDITTYKIPKIPQSVWDDENMKWVVDSPEASMTKVLDNPKIEQHRQDMFHLFKKSPGETDMIGKIIGNKQKDLFGDIDKDKVPNILDYGPKNKSVQGPFDKNFKFFSKKKIDFNKKIKDLI